MNKLKKVTRGALISLKTSSHQHLTRCLAEDDLLKLLPNFENYHVVQYAQEYEGDLKAEIVIDIETVPLQISYEDVEEVIPYSEQLFHAGDYVVSPVGTREFMRQIPGLVIPSEHVCEVTGYNPREPELISFRYVDQNGEYVLHNGRIFEPHIKRSFLFRIDKH